MIRALTKSAFSFSWALYLLAWKQATAFGKTGPEGTGDLFAPVTRAAVDQLDDSMKEMFRSGESFSTRMIDLAVSPWRAMGGIGPASASPSGLAGWLANWTNPVNWMRETAGGDTTRCCEEAGRIRPDSAENSDAGFAARNDSAFYPSASVSWGPVWERQESIPNAPISGDRNI